MAPEDRDRNFEKALARHMRSSASRSSGESAPLKMAACPDAETLAAFHERTLLPEEWDRVNLHVAGCAHCMTLLAQLEATDAIPLETHSAAESQAGSFAPAAAATVAPASVATSAPPKKSRRVLRLPGARWHYLAPAGALAAGLLVWIAIHENRSVNFAAKQAVQVAENRTSPPPVSPPVSAPVPNAASEARAKSAEPFADKSEAASNKRAADALKPAAALDELEKDKTLVARNEARAALSEKESNLKKDGVRQAGVNAIRSQIEEAARDQKVAGGVAGGAVRQDSDALLQAQVQNNAPLQNQANSNQALGGPTPLGQATAPPSSAGKALSATKPAATAKAAAASTTQAVLPPPPPPASENQQVASQAGRMVAPAAGPRPPAPAPSQPSATGAAVSKYTSSAAVETVSGFANPRMITVPGSSFVWRAGPSGVIEFSRNDGTSWTRQTSGVTADLLTGSAPSEKVCWIVGRTGTILLTTDGGAHWKLLKPPFAEDFGGVRATDALHATVWNARNTLNYQTADGGATWTPVPNP